MKKGVKVLLIVFLLSAVCYCSGVSYMYVCEGPEPALGSGLSFFPEPDTSGINQTCMDLGIDRQVFFGIYAVPVFFGWVILGAVWLLILIRLLPPWGEWKEGE